MFRTLLTVVLSVSATSSALAQGLVWALPAQDGAWVQYEGELQQVMFDPTGDRVPTIEDARSTYACNGPKLEFANVMCWRRKLWIRSVGREKAMFRGKEEDCRWIEFKLITGIVPEGEVEITPGPVGTRLLKVLVPESAVLGKTEDGRGIPVAFLPVVRGVQRLGEDGPITPIKQGVLQLYPMFTLVAQYRTLAPDASAGDPGLVLDVGASKAMTGTVVTESKTDRSTNTGILWMNDQVAFGLAKWEVTVIREKKDPTEDRGQFIPRARLHIAMKLEKTGLDAVSELPTPAAAPNAPAPGVPAPGVPGAPAPGGPAPGVPAPGVPGTPTPVPSN